MDGVIDLGEGEAVVIMQGFAMQPRTYLDTARLMAERCRVIIPPLFARPGLSWSPDAVLADLEATFAELGVEQMTMVGHSFGGALELEFATRHVDRITELVFVDTLAMAHEWSLAAEAVHPSHLIWMATPKAARDFVTSFVSHPLCLAQAGWWGFRSDRHLHADEVAASDIPAHVLWAERDSILKREDGAAFAAELDADFTVVHGPGSHPIDHDWFYRHPHLLVAQLERLGLKAWS